MTRVGRRVPYPYLEISGPDGRGSTTPLLGGRVTVGRSTPCNTPDVSLEPDDRKWISRIHCIFEHEAGVWSVRDNVSANGTRIRRDGRTAPLLSDARLRNGDVVCILADVADFDEETFWELRFVDPFTTQRASSDDAGRAKGPFLVYDLSQFRLYRYHADDPVDAAEGPKPVEVLGLGPKGHRMVRYMADRSHRNGGGPVACTHDELIRAVWGEPGERSALGYTPQSLRGLVYELRRRIEVGPGPPQLLLTERGIGYRLMLGALGPSDLSVARPSTSMTGEW